MLHVEYRLHKALLLYIPPVLIMLGTLGNFLTILILSRRSMRRNATYIYLIVLAIADIIVLYMGLLRMWIAELVCILLLFCMSPS